MAGVVWTPVAESDLDDVLFYISFVDRRPPYSSPRNLAIADFFAPKGPKHISPGQSAAPPRVPETGRFVAL